MQNQMVKFVTRIASAVIIFLLPTLIKIVFSMVTDVSSFVNFLTTCSDNATSENIAHLKELSKQKLEERKPQSKEYNVVYEKSSYVIARARENESNGISGGSSDLYSFLMNYEGHSPYCDSSNTQYKAEDIGDGHATIGYGVTDHVMSVSVGDCVAVETVDKYFMDNIDATKLEVEKEVSNAGISDWDEAKTDATTSIGYNCGMTYAKKVIQGYAASGNDGALLGFKSCTHAENGNESFTEGLKTRRDGEYELFISGNYETGFYERTRKYID